MWLSRSIVAMLLSVMLIASSAPRTNAAVIKAGKDPHSCCRNHKAPTPEQKDKCKGTGNCEMQCCRVIPAPAESQTQLVSCGLVVQTQVIPPLVLHSLTESQAIFHPPRA
jgi:hypothetical protein